MTRVLILDSDATLTSAVARRLSEVGLTVVEHNRAAIVREAVEAGPFDVVLLDWRFCDVLPYLGGARVLVMLSYADPAQERELARRFTLIRKPFTSVELLSLLQQELGPLNLRTPRLLDALREAHAAGATARFVVAEGAEVHVVDGEIHDACYRQLRGEVALRALLTHAGPAREAPPRAVERTIHKRIRRLLLDLLGQLDDAEQQR